MKNKLLTLTFIGLPILFILFEFVSCLRGSMPYKDYMMEKEFIVSSMDKINPVYAFYTTNSRERFVFKSYYGDFDAEKLDTLIGKKVKIYYVKTTSLYLNEFLKNYRVAKLETDGIVIFDNIIDSDAAIVSE